MHRKSRGKYRGFSLVDGLAVIITIAVLSTIAVPLYLHLLDRGREAATEKVIQNIGGALGLYFIDHNEYPDVPNIRALATMLEREEYMWDVSEKDDWGQTFRYMRLSKNEYVLESFGSNGKDDPGTAGDDIILNSGTLLENDTGKIGKY